MAALYVYITDQCKDDAETHGVTKDIEKLAEKLEIEQSPQSLESFPPPYLKKRMGKQGRLVIEERHIDEDLVLCLARYFIRGSTEYEAFYKDTNAYYEKNKVSHDNIAAFLEQRKQTPPITKTPLSDIESAYLQQLSSIYNGHEEGTFMESYDWFERISQSWFKSYLPRYFDLIEKIESGKLPESQTVISSEKNSDIKIIFRRFSNDRKTFLIAPIDPKKTNDETDIRKKYENILDATQIPHEDIIRNSRRAYPSIITYDETIWGRVQNSVEANLALSPEEEDILESVLTQSNHKPKYPLFINGRPGSGKSTILQYLFSEHLQRYIELKGSNNSINPPLYLTYSTPLLDQARSLVENILTCGARNLQNGNEVNINTGLEQILQRSFRNFRDFLLEQLPTEERGKFVASNYIDYEQFRKKWDTKRQKHPEPEVRNIGTELAWHAIRTFIKGMQHESGTEVDPEFYEIELARDSKSISDTIFKTIYKHVWKNWYQPLCDEDGYWDDQDLAKAVLECSADKLSRYPAVFCDEAQDFTSIELDLIERLSLYSKRALPSYLAKHVPFAFAGDPFQTLNPTGFNWDAMQSGFHDNIVKKLDGCGTAKLEFNFQELSFNYRSSEHIVKLANLIQLLRAVLLKIKGLRPQQSWTRKATVSPVWFRREDASCQSAIREQEELVIIIPCQENGELEYIQNDTFLSNVALLNGNVSRNILSPARAKGLEYDRLVLYGFGDEAIKRVPGLLKHISAPELDPPDAEERLAWEYYLNQFYVAISRARKRLFIMDSDESLKKFWIFTDFKKHDILLSLYKNNEAWSPDNLGGTIQGDENSWSDDRDDPHELAERWKEQGFAQRDSYLLMLAKSNFQRAGCPEKASLCEAAAYEYNEEFIKAGETFKLLRNGKEACRCYWSGKDFTAVADLVRDFPEIASCHYYLLANFIIREKTTASQTGKLITTLDKINQLSPDISNEISAWRCFFEKLIFKLTNEIESNEMETSNWKVLADSIEKTLYRLCISKRLYPDLGKLYFLVGAPQTGIEYWAMHSSDRKQTEPNWVLRAKAQTEPYPTNIIYFDRLNDYKAIIGIWRINGEAISKETPVNLILKSATKLGDLAAIKCLLPSCHDFDRIVDVLQLKECNLISELRGSIPIAIIQCMESESDWESIVAFSNNQKIQNKQINILLKNSDLKWTPPVTIAAAVRVIARSERLASEMSKNQQIISEFLKEHLIVDHNANDEKIKAMFEIHKFVDIAEVGSAFERAFRLTFALEYYEQWFKGPQTKNLCTLNPDAEILAKRRWLVCKDKLGNTQEGTRGDKYKNEARQFKNEWNLTVDHEHEYPELDPIRGLNILTKSTHVNPPPEHEITTQTESLKKKFTIGICEFSVEVFKIKNRVIVTNNHTQDQIKCGPDTVTSDDVNIESQNSDIKKWLISEWNMVCFINRHRNKIEIQLADINNIIKFEQIFPALTA